MQIDSVLNLVRAFAFENPLISLVIIAIVALFFMKKPRVATKLAALLIFIVVGFHLVSQLGDSSFKGIQDKRGGTQKTLDAMQNQ